MRGPEAWPALAGLGDLDLRAPLAAERATWGKVHGASSDFRWIAATRGFAALAERPERELSLGTEGEPAVFGLWRAGSAHLLAARCHPSRAVDAAGRSGTLEKQVLGCRRRTGLPAAAAAMLLLPRVAELDDSSWWGAVPLEGWESDPDLVHDLGPALEIPLTRTALEASVAAARAALATWVGGQGGEEVLAALYAGLLAGRPPLLHGSDFAPLPAPAIAALLLPFDRATADRLSVAGWLPSTRRPAADLGRLWDLVIHDSGLGPPAATPAGPPDTVRRARAMARAVLSGEPGALGTPERRTESPPTAGGERPPAPGDPAGSVPSEVAFPVPLDLSAPPLRSGAWLLLHEFARDPKRRWLAPEDLAESLRSAPAQGDRRAAETAAGWITTLGKAMPAGVDPEQWQVKTDLLRAAVTALVPGAVTAGIVGPPESGRVPSSYYTDAFERMASAPSSERRSG